MFEKIRQTQFRGKATARQNAFDVCFGIVLPLVCFYFDPIVFKVDLHGERAVLGFYKTFAYVFCFTSILVFAVWLYFGSRLKWLNAVFAGLFFSGAAISLAIGVIIFPYSLLGLIILIGALGFTPFPTAFVYLRSGFRAAAIAKNEMSAGRFNLITALSAVFSVAVPEIINLAVNNYFQ